MMGAVLGGLAFDLVRFRRAVTLTNLESHLHLAGPHGSHVEVGRRSYANFGRALVEFARLPTVDAAYIKRYIELRGLDNLDRAKQDGKGAILVTGHFGSWELMGCILARLGYPVTFVVGIQRNPLVQDLMNGLRREVGIEIIEISSTHRIAHALRNGRFLAMLCDQDAGTKGVFVRFLEDPVSTVQGPARLAIMTGAPIIPGFIIRLGGSKHRIVIEPPVGAGPAGGKETVTSLTQAYTSVIESFVKKYPDHWLWAHRRWKTRPG